VGRLSASTMEMAPRNPLQVSTALQDHGTRSEVGRSSAETAYTTSARPATTATKAMWMGTLLESQPYIPLSIIGRL
jgi:hypothetical protein